VREHQGEVRRLTVLCLGEVGVRKWSLRVDVGCTEEEIVGAARRRVGLDEG